MTDVAPVNATVVYGLSILGSAVVAAFFHRKVRVFSEACLATAVAVVLISFTADTVLNGRIEGWWLVIMWTLGALAYATSYAVGWLMDRAGMSARKRH